MGWRHAVAAVVVMFANKNRWRGFEFEFPLHGAALKLFLNNLEKHAIENRSVIALKDLALRGTLIFGSVIDHISAGEE